MCNFRVCGKCVHNTKSFAYGFWEEVHWVSSLNIRIHTLQRKADSIAKTRKTLKLNLCHKTKAYFSLPAIVKICWLSKTKVIRLLFFQPKLGLVDFLLIRVLIECISKGLSLNHNSPRFSHCKSRWYCFTVTYDLSSNKYYLCT